MALIKCEECGKEISNTAKTCPHCGYENKKEENLYQFMNLAKYAYYYAEDTGLLDFPFYAKNKCYATADSYTEYLTQSYAQNITEIFLALNTMGNKKEYNYDGLFLLLPFYDEYFKGTFCVAIAKDRYMTFTTKKYGIKIIELTRSTLDVKSFNYNSISFNASVDSKGQVNGNALFIDKHIFNVSNYDNIMRWYLKYCIDKINNGDYDLSYKKGTIKEKVFTEEQTANALTGGCYVATAVYGSYDCPEVWTLRRFRDNFLDKKFLGRYFIKLYYKTSPTLVKYFGNNKYFKKTNKYILDKFVNTLKKNGYTDTKYKDKY